MILAEELAAKEDGDALTAKAASDQLGRSLSSISYHVVELAKAGALEVIGGEQKRGAWQKHYEPSDAFRATMTDTVALDQIAELIDGEAGFGLSVGQIDSLKQTVRATGRPVEA